VLAILRRSEERGLRFYGVRSRVSREVRVADFARNLRQKARWSRAFCLETVVGVPQPDTQNLGSTMRRVSRAEAQVRCRPFILEPAIPFVLTQGDKIVRLRLSARQDAFKKRVRVSGLCGARGLPEWGADLRGFESKRRAGALGALAAVELYPLE
jgi:hypothetical protein